MRGCFCSVWNVGCWACKYVVWLAWQRPGDGCAGGGGAAGMPPVRVAVRQPHCCRHWPARYAAFTPSKFWCPITVKHDTRMAKAPGPIRKLWYSWKMMQLPWRRKWLVGKFLPRLHQPETNLPGQPSNGLIMSVTMSGVYRSTREQCYFSPSALITTNH